MTQYYAGIDLGSSSLKLILIDKEGNTVKECNEKYSIESPVSGWREIRPEVWYEAAVTGLKKLFSDTDRSKISGIGITGQMHTTVFLDREGRCIAPAILWNDTRTKDLIPDLKEILDTCDNTKYLAKNISTGSPAANLCWLKDTKPELFRRLEHFLIGPDYLVYRLTGTYGTDYCEASTSSLFDWGKNTWSTDAMRLLELPPKIFPEIKGCACTAGNLLPSLAKQLGLDNDVKVIVGTGDNVASAISGGYFRQPMPLLSLGTSGVITFPREAVDLKRKGKNVLFSLNGSDIHVITQGAIQSCGSSLDWWFKNILHDKLSEADSSVSEQEPEEMASLLFYPHLAGEKTIYQDPTLQGAFIGLNTHTTRTALGKSVLEGIAFSIRQLIDELDESADTISELIVIGGGAESEALLQTLADILHVHIKKGGRISAARGIALLAACDGGSLRSLSKPSGSAGDPEDTLSCRQSRYKLYEQKYLKYLKIHDALISIYGTLEA